MKKMYPRGKKIIKNRGHDAVLNYITEIFIITSSYISDETENYKDTINGQRRRIDLNNF